jgi:hypothetical protein
MLQKIIGTEIDFDNPRIEKQYFNLTKRLGILSEKHSYGSPIQSIKDYARKLGRELSENPSRSIYLDRYIRKNELNEDLGQVSNTQLKLEDNSYLLFNNLFEHLNHLIQLRYEMVPTKGKKPTGTKKEFLNQKRPEFDNAITELGQTINIFLQALSNQSRDYVEDYIRDHHELVHRFMNSKMPKSQIKFRDLLGLNLNVDGTKRIKHKRIKPSTEKKVDSSISYAIQDEGNFYKIKLPHNAGIIYAEKVSRVYKDGYARFRPTDPAILNFLKNSSGGRDYIVAIIEPRQLSN